MDLAFVVGTPFGYHKFGGGFASDFVGFRIRYDLVEVGISEKRGKWLVDWIKKLEANRYVVQVRDFSEFLGRLGFASHVVETAFVTSVRVGRCCPRWDGV